MHLPPLASDSRPLRVAGYWFGSDLDYVERPMKLRLALLAAFAALWVGCQCGPSNLCDGITCIAPLVCELAHGRCVGPTGGTGGGAAGVGGGTSATGGGTAGVGGGGGGPDCNLSCSGAAPVCDVATHSCKTCTATQGCNGSTPVCDGAGNFGNGRCVTCTEHE